MTTAPFVELGFNPTDLRPRDLPSAGAFLGSPADALEAALAVARARMVDQMVAEARGLGAPTQAQLLHIADLAWQTVFWQFRKVSAPIIADAYLRAYRAADAGDVPINVIYSLADKHAEKIGDYFHNTSRDALAEGFSTMVNRRVPAKAAADKVLDGYGLTPRQMRSYAAAKQFDTPVADVMPRSLKARARAYIDKSFFGRAKKLAAQEEHNIDEQAQQFAWMWLQDKGRLSDKAQKVWITARDERVCPVCGPLHGKRVGINEQFKTAQGEFWTPGLHPNCRCQLRLLENRFAKGIIVKADFNPKLHPRGGDPENKGRFSRLPATKKEEAAPGLLIPLPTEIPEEEEGLSMGEQGGTLSMGGERKLSMGGLSMSGTLSMGGGLSMAGAAVESENLSMTGGQKKLSMSRTEAAEKLSMLSTPKMRMDADRTLSLMMADTEAYVKPKKRQLTRYDRPTIHIQDDQGHEYPVYTVVKPNQLNWSGDQVELDHTVPFTPSLSRARAWASADFHDQIIDNTDLILETDLHRLQKREGGHTWTAELDDKQVLEVVNWAAWQGRVSDPDSSPDYDFGFEWSDEGGNLREDSVPISRMAKSLHVDPSDFEVRILRMDEGHDSREGQTVMDEAGTKRGYENWLTSGRYNASEIRTEEIGHNLSLRVFWIDPDVEETGVPFD
jgi:Phage Mu protein F like protein